MLHLGWPFSAERLTACKEMDIKINIPLYKEVSLNSKLKEKPFTLDIWRNTMPKIRRLGPKDAAAAIKLADHVFRPDGGHSMGKSFPHIFLPHQIGNSFGIYKNGRLV